MKLKNLFYVLLTLMCVAAVPAVAQESTEATEGAPMVITLDEALQIALSDNPTVKVADKTIEKKQYAKGDTEGPIIELVDNMFNDAHEMRASDIPIRSARRPYRKILREYSSSSSLLLKTKVERRTPSTLKPIYYIKCVP